jgi:hypothetical protein
MIFSGVCEDRVYCIGEFCGLFYSECYIIIVINFICGLSSQKDLGSNIGFSLLLINSVPFSMLLIFFYLSLHHYKTGIVITQN